MLEQLLIITFLNGPLSYDKDAKPIFEKRCAQCHNANWPATNWLDYTVAKDNKDKIKFRLENKSMPPGNSTGMTEDERKTIIKWINEGAKK